MSYIHFFPVLDECSECNVASHRITWQSDEAFPWYPAPASPGSLGCLPRTQSFAMCNY